MLGHSDSTDMNGLNNLSKYNTLEITVITG